MLLGTVLLPVLAKVSPRSFLIGLPVVLLGQAFRIWSSGHLDKMASLSVSGPFALCRNPLYIGTFLMTEGYLLMCDQISLLIGGTLLFWLFHAGAVAEEESMLREKFGEPFDDYCKKVPRYFPRFTTDFGNGRFSMALVKENREYKAIISASIIVLLFALKAFFGQALWHAPIW